MPSWLLIAAALALPVSPELYADCATAKSSNDVDGLEACVTAWVETDPDSAYTDYYGYFWALARQDHTAAQVCYRRAVTKDLPKDLEADLEAHRPTRTLMQSLGRIFPVLGVMISLLLIAAMRIWYAMGPPPTVRDPTS